MWGLVVLISAALTLLGCSFSADYGDSQKAVDIFHGQMDRGEYAAIYDNAAKAFQTSATRDQLIGFLTRVNRKMGKCGEAAATFGGY
jgi:hypothetical protein